MCAPYKYWLMFFIVWHFLTFNGNVLSLIFNLTLNMLLVMPTILLFVFYLYYLFVVFASFPGSFWINWLFLKYIFFFYQLISHSFCITTVSGHCRVYNSSLGYITYNFIHTPTIFCVFVIMCLNFIFITNQLNNVEEVRKEKYILYLPTHFPFLTLFILCVDLVFSFSLENFNNFLLRRSSHNKLGMWNS